MCGAHRIGSFSAASTASGGPGTGNDQTGNTYAISKQAFSELADIVQVEGIRVAKHNFDMVSYDSDGKISDVSKAEQLVPTIEKGFTYDVPATDADGGIIEGTFCNDAGLTVEVEVAAVILSSSQGA